LLTDSVLKTSVERRGGAPPQNSVNLLPPIPGASDRTEFWPDAGVGPPNRTAPASPPSAYSADGADRRQTLGGALLATVSRPAKCPVPRSPVSRRSVPSHVPSHLSQFRFRRKPLLDRHLESPHAPARGCVSQSGVPVPCPSPVSQSRVPVPCPSVLSQSRCLVQFVSRPVCRFRRAGCACRPRIPSRLNRQAQLAPQLCWLERLPVPAGIRWQNLPPYLSNRRDCSPDLGLWTRPDLELWAPVQAAIIQS